MARAERIATARDSLPRPRPAVRHRAEARRTTPGLAEAGLECDGRRALDPVRGDVGPSRLTERRPRQVTAAVRRAAV